MQAKEAPLSFAPPKERKERAGNSWRVLIVDDDPSAHEITRLALHDFRYQERGIHFVSAYSAQEAISVLKSESAFALIFLDIVMESQDAGLLVVQYVREIMHDSRTRIVVRTGEPGEVPEREIIDQYDINDYKEKTELSVEKLYTVVRTAISQYHQIAELYDNELRLRLMNNSLERRIEEALKREKAQQEKIFDQSRSVMMRDLLNMLAHQWRQPLSAISTAAAQMRLMMDLGEADRGRLQESLQSIEETTLRLSETIKTFRELHEPGRREPLGRQIAKAMELVESGTRSKGISIDVTYTGCEAVDFSNDIVQIILYLLKNSQEALVHNKVAQPAIAIRIWQEQKVCYIEISDNAGGVPEAVRSKIFDPYFSTSEERNGRGLGLYHASMMVRERFNGKITLINTAKGAAFTLHLPTA